MFDFKNAFLGKSRKKIILDTDTFNEIDDQYAVAYAMRSTEQLELLGICAAPFSHGGSDPAVGMEQSYRELTRIMQMTDPTAKIPTFRGSEQYMTQTGDAVPSPAADFIIKTARESNERIFVVAIGAITNVASALKIAPDIKEKIAVVWLGGHVLHRWQTREYNLWGDVAASQYVFDCGVDLLQIPCMGGGCDALLTTIPELEYYMAGKGELCDYLLNITKQYNKNNLSCWSKVIWDISAIALFTVPEAFRLVTLPRPIITSDGNYAQDLARPLYTYVEELKRDPIFRDLFAKLAK